MTLGNSLYVSFNFHIWKMRIIISDQYTIEKWKKVIYAKNLPEMQTIPLEKEMATHSSILGWEIPWTKEPGVLQSMWSERVGHGLVTEQQQQQVIYLWMAVLGPRGYAGFSLVVASRGYCWLRCLGFSLWWLLMLKSTEQGSRHAGFSSCTTWAQ